MTDVIFRKVTVADAKKLLDWRTSPRIADVSLTVVPYDVEMQEGWIRTSATRSDFKHWVLVYQGVDVGYVAIKDLSGEAADITWYIGEEEYSFLFVEVALEVMSYVFTKMNKAVIISQILASNKKMLALTDFLCFERMVGGDKHFERNGETLAFLGYTAKKERFLTRWPLDSHTDTAIEHHE